MEVWYTGSKTPEYVAHSQGMARANGSSWNYQYNLTDHLGNVRYATDAGKTFEQSTDYFPFGLAHSTTPTGLAKNKYLYNGKELQTELGFNLLDYHARFYDATIGILDQIDPMVEKYASTSPYVYCGNNPMLFIDPDGMDIYMYFYVDGHEKEYEDDMFMEAAFTRGLDMLKNGTLKQGDVYTVKRISDIGQLKKAVESTIAELSPDYGKTAEFGLWSHAALDGPRGSTMTSGRHSLGMQLSTEGWGEINFNWKNDGFDAKALFFGCRTGADKDDNGNDVIPWAQKISNNKNMQNVEVFGQPKRTYPSLIPNGMRNNSDIRKHIHDVPRYLVAGDRNIEARARRRSFLPGGQSYPMKIYRNGKYT